MTETTAATLAGRLGECVGQLTEIWRYPVKSMAGEPVEQAMVRPGSGIDGDRCYAVRELRTGKILSAKTVEPLLCAQARTVQAGVVVITLPDGSEHQAGSPGCDSALSDWLDRPVCLQARAAGTVWRFDRAVEPAADSAIESMATQPGSFFDGKSPIHLLSSQSIDGCRPLLPEADWDVRRFRPNLLVDAPGPSFPEDHWIGATLRLGESRLWVRREATRCVVPARAHLGLPADPRIFHTIARQRRNILGIRLNPTRAGLLHRGQQLVLQDFGGPPAGFAELRR